jgi:hypothetical protein
MSIKVNIDTKKIDKKYLAKGRYLNIYLRKRKEGKDEYGNDGFVAQAIPKDLKEDGLRGPIIGNYKEYTDVEQTPYKPQSLPVEDTQDIPF